MGFSLMTLPTPRDAAISDIATLLVHTEREKEAARLFLEWFISRQGRATKKEVSGFAHRLASGKMSFGYGRTTFYRYVLRPFLDSSLIELENEIDHASGRTINKYRRIIQPVKRRRPSGPSLFYNAHLLAEKWNWLFGA